MGDLEVRIPVIENLGYKYGYAFSNSKRPLTESEKDLARPIFQSSINLEKVRVIKTDIINAPTTLGNNIRVSPGNSMSDATLIHELTHIWQFQTQGNRYISNSLYHQCKAIIKHGDRNAAYEVKIALGKSFYSYTAEQQAVIIEQYFLNRYNERANNEYKRMLKEVRSAKPTISDESRYMESLYGGRNWYQEQLREDRPERIRFDRVIPVFRLEW